MSLPKIIDNDHKTLLDTLKEVSGSYDEISIATGYWDLPGTELLYQHIAKYKKVRLLIGRETLIPRHRQNTPESDFPSEDIINDLQLLAPTERLRGIISDIKKLISEGRLEVRVYTKTFLHAKAYIFGNYGSENGVGIIGSSNFTKNGLTQNAELNALESDHRIVYFKPQSDAQEYGHLAWFDRFWNDESSIDWNGEFAEILSESPVGDMLFSPYQTYIKTLFELYGEELDEVALKDTGDKESELYTFQKKNVHALLRRLKKYRVAMLADSVGLGKTYTAIEVIKQYRHSDNGKQRVEVICPKSLSAQWKKEALKQGEDIQPVTLQNVNHINDQRALDSIANVTLFVIDESHNLKNRSSKRFEQIVSWIENNPAAHVLLLTATPINNQLSDITNQILLGSRGRADIFKLTVNSNKQIETIDFNQAIENLKKKINQDITNSGEVDYAYIRQTMSPILRAFVVRQTRQGIQREYGGLQIDGEQKVFPQVYPEVKKYSFSQEASRVILGITSATVDLQKLYALSTQDIVENTKNLLHPIDQIEKLQPRRVVDQNDSPIFFVFQTILMLGFLPYRWRIYQTKFYGKTRTDIKNLKLAASSAERKSLFLQLSIYGILRTMYLKRMESSVSSCRKSINIYKRKIDIFERGIEAGQIISVKDLQNIEVQLEMESEEYDVDDFELGEEYVVDTIADNNYNVKAIKADIAKERALISILEEQMQILEQDDSKLVAFAELMDSIAQEKVNGGKILVFSFYADTVAYLKENLLNHTKHFSKQNTEFLTAMNRKDAESITGRFSPTSKDYVLADDETELSCLVATDVLSEGQNLQDCGILINYDLHWNPVRMIQRNGRVNRLGTAHDSVYIYNLSPESKIEEHLKLVSSLEKKINLIRNTIGTDTPVLDEKENPLEFGDSWSDIYSDDMKKRLEALEAAEQDADILLSEDVYIADLKHFDAQTSDLEKKRVYNIPLGKWAHMPQAPHQGKKNRPEILTLNTLRGVELINGESQKITTVGHTFLGMSRNLQQPVRYVSTLEALEWLKVEEDFTKSPDRISCDKAAVRDHANKRAEKTEVVSGSIIGQERDLIQILIQNHLPEADVRSIKSALQTKNILDAEKINRLKRGIVKSGRDGRINLAQIKELTDIAKKVNTQHFEDQSEVDHNVQQLIYVKENN